MNFEALLHSFTGNVESIIQWLFLAILALTGFLISRGLLSRNQDGPKDGAPAAGPSPELEGVLKQILERTQKLESVTLQGGLSPEAAALAETQVQGLKKELAAREEELKALKASGGGGAGDAKMSEEAAKLNTRLKELESKLAEYEILEDDIADLSLYKEENTRLRAELNKAKGGAETAAPAAAAAPPAAAPAPAATPAAAAATDDIVAEFAQAVSAEPLPAAVPDAGGPGVIMQVPDTGNPMKDFEAAVQIEKKMVDKTAPPPAAAPAPAAAAAPAAKAPAGPKGEADDLFAEFSESPDQSADGLDTDKMMAEMAALVSLEPSDSALDEGIDTEKMAAEAGSLGKR